MKGLTLWDAKIPSVSPDIKTVVYHHSVSGSAVSKNS